MLLAKLFKVIQKTVTDSLPKGTSHENSVLKKLTLHRVPSTTILTERRVEGKSVSSVLLKLPHCHIYWLPHVKPRVKQETMSEMSWAKEKKDLVFVWV